MAELERRATAAAPARADENADIDQLPTMFGKLGDDVMQLIDAKLGLLKIELKEEASVYTRTGALIAVGGVIAAIGFTLANIAVAFFVARLFFMSFTPPISYALGFVVTGAIYLIIGAIIIVTMKNRLAAHSAAPQRSIEELRKDKQWLKNEL
ncbi:MAG: putative Actinobacterial Holin-X, holin superfamily [Acidobacteriota bacterium]|nr:putative Actinobacterial Holin-X, holin superfamily [Acidobacteriota bacterium]